MAVIAPRPVPSHQFHRRPGLPPPLWPTTPIDPAGVDAHYDASADELTLYFSHEGKQIDWYSDPIDEPAGGHVAMMVEEETGRVVGIHGRPFLVGAVAKHPAWTKLTWGLLAGEYGAEMVGAALPDFIAEVQALAARYGADGPVAGLDGGRQPS